MTYFPVVSPYEIFFDLDGNPLEEGYIYIGEANQNPITNQITVYWDSTGLYPAAQPIRTIEGYPDRNGSPAKIYVNAGAFEDYSILINDKHGRLVFTAQSARFDIMVSGNTVDLINDLRSISGYSQPIDIRGHSAIGDGGHGRFEWFDGAAPGFYIDDNGFTIVPTTGDGSGAWIRQDKNILVEDYGALGDGITDDTTAIQNCLNNGGLINFKSGKTYIISDELTIDTETRIIGYGATIKWLNGVDKNMITASVKFECYGLRFVGGLVSDAVANITLRGIYIIGSSANIEKIIIKNCRFEYFNLVGIYIYSSQLSGKYQVRNVIIADNSFVGHDDQLQAITLFGGENVVIKGNIIDGMDSVSILCDDATTSSALSNYGRLINFTIADNIISMPNANNPLVNYGIQTCAVEGLTITGNVVQMNNGWGIISSIYDLGQQASAPGGGAAYLPIDEDNARVCITGNSIYNASIGIRVEGYLSPVISGNNLTATSVGLYIADEAGTVDGTGYSFPTGGDSLANVSSNTVISKNAACIGGRSNLERTFWNDNSYIGTFALRYETSGVAALSTQVIRDADQQMSNSGTIITGPKISGNVYYSPGQSNKTISLVDGASNVIERWLGYTPTLSIGYIVLTESPWSGISCSIINKSLTSFQIQLSAVAPSGASVFYTIIHSLTFKP